MRTFRQHSDFPLEHVATSRFVPGVAWSDHRSFWRHGYRAIMVTDTAFYRYPYYHTRKDTSEKLAYPEFTRVTAGLAEAFAALAIEGLESERDSPSAAIPMPSGSPHRVRSTGSGGAPGRFQASV